MSRRVIFQELHVAGGNIMQLIPFVRAFEFPLFYSHHNYESDVTIIHFVMGTQQGDPLGGTLFTLAHFKALHFITNHFLYCLFPSNVDDIHIIGPFLLYHLHMNIFKPNFM
jgi:hypothetical protein